jgi:hypothetical protein
MFNFYISACDLPAAKLAADVRLYAGRGWLALVREATAIIGDSEIMAIREDAGALRIELTPSTPEQRSALHEIEERSLRICEICGERGKLRYEGMNNGRRAGWHRTRCERHVNTRTSSVVPPILDQIANTCSGLFIHAPAATAQVIADALRAAGKPVAVLIESDKMETAIYQVAIQLKISELHTLPATLEQASTKLGKPIYLVVERAERFERSEITYALKSARDSLNSSEFFGLRIVFVGTDFTALRRMARLSSAAFFGADVLDSSPEERSVFDLAEREQMRRDGLRIALSHRSSTQERRVALLDLATVLRLDREVPLGTAAHLSTEEIRGLVPVIVREGRIPYVRDTDIPEPWARRFGIASIGSTRVLAGAYVHDWENFLRLWDEEHVRLIDALEDLEDV